jgi:hypothetical protein
LLQQPPGEHDAVSDAHDRADQREQNGVVLEEVQFDPPLYTVSAE